MNLLHHWLLNSDYWKRTVVEQIVPWGLAGVELGDTILEIGPGPGVTTDLLRRSHSQLTCVEIDAGLADGLRRHAAFVPNHPQSNIVVADIVKGDLAHWLAAFKEAGVLGVDFGPQRMRMVTHLNITADDITDALSRIDRVVGAVAV